MIHAWKGILWVSILNVNLINWQQINITYSGVVHIPKQLDHWTQGNQHQCIWEGCHGLDLHLLQTQSLQHRHQLCCTGFMLSWNFFLQWLSYNLCITRMRFGLVYCFLWWNDVWLLCLFWAPCLFLLFMIAIGFVGKQCWESISRLCLILGSVLKNRCIDLSRTFCASTLPYFLRSYLLHVLHQPRALL